MTIHDIFFFATMLVVIACGIAIFRMLIIEKRDEEIYELYKEELNKNKELLNKINELEKILKSYEKDN